MLPRRYENRVNRRLIEELSFVRHAGQCRVCTGKGAQMIPRAAHQLLVDCVDVGLGRAIDGGLDVLHVDFLDESTDLERLLGATHPIGDQLVVEFLQLLIGDFPDQISGNR